MKRILISIVLLGGVFPPSLLTPSTVLAEETKLYQVRVQKDGKTWIEEVRCGDTFTARKVVKERVPGCVILDVKEVRKK